MVFFGAELESTKEAKSFVSFVRENEFFKRGGRASIATREDNEHILVFVEMRFPKLPWWAMSMLSIVAAIVLGTGTWTYVLAGIFLVMEFFYMRFLWYAIFRMGLRKRGYAGTKRLLSVDECLGWLVK